MSRTQTRGIALILGLLAVLALAVAGCGGSSDDDQANEEYADSVCTAVATWDKQIRGIVNSITIADLTTASMQAKMSEAESATKVLTTEMAAIPPPDSSDGKAAKQQLDQLSADVTTTVSTAQTAVSQLKGNASIATIQATIALLAPQVKSVVSSAQSAVESLKTAGGSLSSAFKNTDSCKSLGD